MGGTPQRKVAVSVDLDAVACYYRIHALGEPPDGPARHAILRRCLPRFAELFARHDLQATFFVVGADLEQDPEGRALLADLARAGHELANHSHTHRYDFARLRRARDGRGDRPRARRRRRLRGRGADRLPCAGLRDQQPTRSIS